MTQVEARIRRDFAVHEKPSKLVVDFGCDLAPEEPRQVWSEDGSGHGGSLRLVRMTREQGGSFAVRAIEHYRDTGTELKVSHVGARDVDRIVARSRVAIADRDFFTARFAATMTESPMAYWWVRERYVAIAAELGTVDAIPPLVDLARGTARANGPGSETRLREAALDAIAAITGWNARVDPFGRTRSSEKAAEAVSEECYAGP